MKPTTFLLEDFLPYALSVAANRISRLFARRYSTAFGLSIAEWRVMAVLGRHGTLSAGSVCEHTEMDKVKVSRAAASLAAKGLAAQTPDPADGRVRRLALTGAGQEMHARIVKLALELEAQLSGALPAQEWRALHTALRKVTAHARALDADNPPQEP